MAAFSFRSLALVCVMGPSAALHAQPMLALEAPLTEVGYQRVAALKSDGDMKTFIKRVLAKLGLDVADEGQLSGFSSYYSGTQAVQHYGTLQSELRVASWVQQQAAETSESASHAIPEPAVKAKATPMPTRAKTHPKETPKAVVARTTTTTAAAATAAPTTTTTTAVAAEVGAAPAKIFAAVEPSHTEEARANSSPARVQSGRANFLGLVVHANNTLAAEAHSLPAVSEANQNLLPAVSEVLSTASETLKVFSANANQMRKKADEMKEASKRNLTLLKSHYEDRLNSFRAENEELIKRSAWLRSNTSLVNATNKVLETQANNVQKSIDILHETFSVLNGRVEVAEGFIVDSLNSTSVDGAPEVQVLAPTTPKPTLEAFLLDARRGLGLGLEASSSPFSPPPEFLDDAVALLQVAAGSSASFEDDEKNAVPKDASQMTSLLLRTLEKLGAAEKTAKRQLKRHFMSAKARWVERNEGLFTEESRLQSQLKAAIQRKEDLVAVKATLMDSNDLLKRKLVEFVEFLSFLDKAADNAVSMASEQVQAE